MNTYFHDLQNYSHFELNDCDKLTKITSCIFDHSLDFFLYYGLELVNNDNSFVGVQDLGQNDHE